MEGVKSSYFSSSSVSVRSVRSSCSLSDGNSRSSIGNVSRKCSTGRCPWQQTSRHQGIHRQITGVVHRSLKNNVSINFNINVDEKSSFQK